MVLVHELLQMIALAKERAKKEPGHARKWRIIISAMEYASSELEGLANQ